MSAFWRVCREVRARLPAIAADVPSCGKILDGLPWEAATPGTSLAEGEYARVAGVVLNPSMHGEFLVLLSRQYSDTHWLVDVGVGGKVSFADFFAVRASKLRRIFDPGDSPTAWGDYFRCQAICSRPVALWPRDVPCCGGGARPWESRQTSEAPLSGDGASCGRG